jgi:hypothetical protein
VPTVAGTATTPPEVPATVVLVRAATVDPAVVPPGVGDGDRVVLLDAGGQPVSHATVTTGGVLGTPVALTPSTLVVVDRQQLEGMS